MQLSQATIIPKHIASDYVKFYKIAYRLRYLVWVVLAVVFYALWQIDGWFLRMWGLWIFVTLIIQKGLPINKTILKFCETVSDTPANLVVTQNDKKICVDYRHIQSIDYLFGWGWLNCYYIKITLNTPSPIGNHIFLLLGKMLIADKKVPKLWRGLIGYKPLSIKIDNLPFILV